MEAREKLRSEKRAEKREKSEVAKKVTVIPSCDSAL
jgi:hypothetical protein